MTRDPSAGGAGPRDDEADDAFARPGLKALLARVAATLAGSIETRAQLAALEFAEERERTRDRLVLLAVVAIASAFALLAINALAVALMWTRLGWGGLFVVALLWTAVAAVAATRLVAQSRRDRRPFDATLAQLERDRAWLAERLGPGRR
ncbi:MAG TPA: phage holin family protein [Burkholderiaceae bacterium]|nr:phage holin family protein [Burkholderiaceae bacterium]